MSDASAKDQYLDDISEIIDLVRARETDDALGLIQTCLPKYPDSPELLLLASVCSFHQDDIGRAIELCETAHKLAPDGQEIVDSLAVLHVLTGQHNDGLYYAKLATTLAPHPDIPDLLPLEFSDFFRALNSTRPSPHYLNGLFEFNSQNFEKASDEFQRELRINPDNKGALKKLGHVLIRLARPSEALKILEAYEQDTQGDAETSALMALAHCYLANFDAAAALCRKALDEDPDSTEIAMQVLESSKFFDGDLESTHQDFLESLYARVAKTLDDDDIESEETNTTNKSRIDVAIVCNSLFESNTATFLLPLLENHNKTRFNITTYQQSPTGGSVFNELKSKSQNWRRIVDIDDDVVEMIIRRSGADIVIDLCGFSENGRPSLFERLKDLVITNMYRDPYGLDAPGTTMVLSDAVTAGTDAALIKPGQTNIFCEGGLFAINEPRLMGEVKALPAKSNGHITFGGTALLAHLSPSTVQMWADILHAVPGSKLHLGYVELASADVKERAAELFADAGLQDRITVWNTDYDQRKNPSYFNAIDIFLDTYPSNRPLDLCHSLWMGVPAISRQGDKRGAMMGASILNSAGQPEWIARSNDEFVSVAASLAADIDALAQIRARLRDDVKTSKLLDTVGYVRGLEAAFEKSLSSR